jgi:phosphoglycolate phosphatase
VHLLIFDIDGTLTNFAGATGAAFNATFESFFGQPGPWGKVRPHGKTDRAILRECLTACDIDGDFSVIFSQFVEPYLRNLRNALETASAARLMPGVRELLEALSVDTRVRLALGTGNIEQGARMKLRRLEVDTFFPVGGFGDFAEERLPLLRDAIRNATRHYQCTFSPQTTWVIGDTTFDIEAGQALGLCTLGVATGGLHSIEDLQQAKPDVVLENLSNTDAALKALGIK